MNITLEQKSFAFHGILGVIIGVLSGIMTKDPYQIPNSGILLLTIGVLAITYYIAKRIFKLAEISTDALTSVSSQKLGDQKKYDFKWYLSNGVYPYLILWLLAWIIIYNI
jgi:hypothetical protein